MYIMTRVGACFIEHNQQTPEPAQIGKYGQSNACQQNVLNRQMTD